MLTPDQIEAIEPVVVLAVLIATAVGLILSLYFSDKNGN